jgi:hypothetical protein
MEVSDNPLCLERRRRFQRASKTLGYVTLTFPPVAGRSLKIELAGRPIDVDAFGQIIEVTGKKDTEAADKHKGTLGIVEIEIYKPIKQ